MACCLFDSKPIDNLLSSNSPEKNMQWRFFQNERNPYHWEIVCDDITMQWWGSLSQFPPFCYFRSFSGSLKYCLPIKRHIDIWQASPQLRCGSTGKIWMRSKGTGSFTKWDISVMEELTNRPLVTPIWGRDYLFPFPGWRSFVHSLQAAAYWDLMDNQCKYDDFFIGMLCCLKHSDSLVQLVTTVETLYSTIYYSKYFIELNFDKSTQYVALWTHKRHPIPRPFGRAMECLLWVFQQKLIVL